MIVSALGDKGWHIPVVLAGILLAHIPVLGAGHSPEGAGRSLVGAGHNPVEGVGRSLAVEAGHIPVEEAGRSLVEGVGRSLVGEAGRGLVEGAGLVAVTALLQY